jgi:transcriptional regulator with XRE-family HTH domain
MSNWNARKKSRKTTEAPRFDVTRFQSALDAERASRGLTWKEVAAEARVSASTLSRLGQGKRPDVDSLAALIVWSGLPADPFLAPAPPKSDREALSAIATYLRSDGNLDPEAAAALEAVIRATYKRLRSR